MVAGLGTIGKPVAKYIHEKGWNVYGYDIKKVENTNFPTTTEWTDIPHGEVGYYIIAVWTGLRENEPDITAVEDVISKISETNKDALTIIESTIPPGTTRKLSEKYGIKIAHCPHRYWSVDPIHYGVRQVRVLGAVDEETLQKALDFYQQLDIPVHVVSKVEIAELSKVVENAYRYLTIAFAEYVKMICDKLNIPFWELRQAVNTKWNVELPEARRGIGGHCLPKDIRYLLSLSQRVKVPIEILNGAIEIDDEYKKHIA